MAQKTLFVTQPFLPPLEEYTELLAEVWASKVVTNGGPMHKRFETALADYLNVEHVVPFNNGTIALLAAIQEARLVGEVITTPFSFVATSHSLLWKGVKPVFVDIDPHTLNLDPEKIEPAITPQTTGIMPVHCYGNPCDTAAIESIADKYNLKVVYDAAHAFAVEDEQGSILRRGDLSVLSFHATKVFTTFEGGAVVCADEKAKARLGYLKNFGFENEVSVVSPGINGKMSEINAAMGLLQLRYIDRILARRKEIYDFYCQQLADLPGVTVIGRGNQTRDNFAYFPVLIGPDHPRSREQVYNKMVKNNIYVRRYFYPLISTFPMYRGLPSAQRENLPVASDIASKILCLPIYPAMTNDDVLTVVDVLKTA